MKLSLSDFSRIFFGIAAVPLVTFLLGGFIFGFVQGNVDICFLQPKYQVYGLSSISQDSIFARWLWERYAIRLNHVAGCVVSLPEISYADTYNWVLQGFYKRRYGYDVVRKLEKEIYLANEPIDDSP